jgi:hypothetical protein
VNVRRISGERSARATGPQGGGACQSLPDPTGFLAGAVWTAFQSSRALRHHGPHPTGRIEKRLEGGDDGVLRGRLREVRLEPLGQAALTLLQSRERREGHDGDAPDRRAVESAIRSGPRRRGRAILMRFVWGSPAGGSRYGPVRPRNRKALSTGLRAKSLPLTVAGTKSRGALETFSLRPSRRVCRCGREAYHARLDSSARTVKLLSVLGPKVLLIATSAASRPRAISTRPTRGRLFLASNVYQWPSR